MNMGNSGGNQSIRVNMNSGITGTTRVTRTFRDPETGQMRTTTTVTQTGPGSNNNHTVRVTNNNQISENNNMPPGMFNGLFDNFGVFSLFGQNPHDPLSSSRVQGQNNRHANPRVHVVNFGDDSGEDMEDLADYANMIRINRFQIHEPSMMNLLNSFIAQRGNVNRGMTENDVNRIKKEKYIKPTKKSDIKIVDGKVIEDEAEKCSVCLIDYEDNVEIRKLPCEHIFHPPCIDTWLRTNKTCPLCKRDVQQMI